MDINETFLRFFVERSNELCIYKMSEIEDLEKFLATEGHTEKRFDALIQLKVALKGTDFARAKCVCIEAVEIATELQEPLLKVNAQRHLANVLWRMGENVKAQELFAACLITFKELKNDEGLAHVYSGLGIVHGTLKDTANALHFFEKALTHAKLGNDEVLLAHIHGNIGNIHRLLEDYISALRYFAKALAMYRELDEEGKHGVANMLNSIAGVLVYQEEYDNAIKHLEEAQSIDEEIGDRRGIAVWLMNLGITYFKAGQHEKALEQLHRSLEYDGSHNAGTYLYMVHEQLSLVYMAIGDTVKSVEHLELYDSFRVEENRMELNRNARKII